MKNIWENINFLSKDRRFDIIHLTSFESMEIFI